MADSIDVVLANDDERFLREMLVAAQNEIAYLRRQIEFAEAWHAASKKKWAKAKAKKKSKRIKRVIRKAA
jgi:hypothetical protein